jgi:Zn-dependent protease with chaperone function
VDRNRFKLAVFVVLFVVGSALLLTAALVAVPGALFGIPYTSDVSAEAEWYWSSFRLVLGATFVALLLAGGIAAAVQLANAEDWVRNRFKGQPAQPGAYPGFESAVSDMALAAGLTQPPGIVVLDSAAINAYALGTNRERATIGVTRAFLETVPAPEQRAVVAALVARIISGDILFATALAALMGPLKLIRGSGKAIMSGGAGCVDSGCFESCCSMPDLSDGCGCLFDGMGDSDSAGSCLGVVGVGLFVVVIAIITYVAVVSAAWIVTLWGRALHRTAYEKADAEGMLLLKEPEAMLAALRRAVSSDTTISDGDPSYDGIFYTPTSGTVKVERSEARRFRRLAEVLGVDGIAAVEHDGPDVAS